MTQNIISQRKKIKKIALYENEIDWRNRLYLLKCTYKAFWESVED
jgi:hypothetical protein